MGLSMSWLTRHRGARTLREIAPRKTPGEDNPLPTLSRNLLLEALGDTASYINRKGGNLTIVAVGGAVNTIHLQNRANTHDLDFFNDSLTPADYKVLLKAAQRTADRHPALDDQWFNNRTVFFIPRDQRSALTAEAFHQNEIIFQQDGLTVLAAPWNYAFCCKVDRLAGTGLNSPQPYDLEDAVQYLNQYVRFQDIHQVDFNWIHDWFRQYSLQWTENNDYIVAEVNKHYRTTFKVDYDVITSSSESMVV